MTQEIMHQVALLPLGVMLALWRTTAFSGRQWVLAAALAVSWVMDSTNMAFIANSPVIFIAQYGKPITVALALGVVVKDLKVLAALVGGLVLLVSASAVQGMATFETVVPVMGGFVVTLYAWHSTKSYLRTGIITYFAGGALGWAAWTYTSSSPSRAALFAWYAYHSARLIGILLITASLVIQARKPKIALV